MVNLNIVYFKHNEEHECGMLFDKAKDLILFLAKAKKFKQFDKFHINANQGFFLPLKSLLHRQSSCRNVELSEAISPVDITPDIRETFVPVIHNSQLGIAFLDLGSLVLNTHQILPDSVVESYCSKDDQSIVFISLHDLLNASLDMNISIFQFVPKSDVTFLNGDHITTTVPSEPSSSIYDSSSVVDNGLIFQTPVATPLVPPKRPTNLIFDDYWTSNCLECDDPHQYPLTPLFASSDVDSGLIPQTPAATPLVPRKRRTKIAYDDYWPISYSEFDQCVTPPFTALNDSSAGLQPIPVVSPAVKSASSLLFPTTPTAKIKATAADAANALSHESNIAQAILEYQERKQSGVVRKHYENCNSVRQLVGDIQPLLKKLGWGVLYKPFSPKVPSAWFHPWVMQRCKEVTGVCGSQSHNYRVEMCTRGEIRENVDFFCSSEDDLGLIALITYLSKFGPTDRGKVSDRRPSEAFLDRWRAPLGYTNIVSPASDKTEGKGRKRKSGVV